LRGGAWQPRAGFRPAPTPGGAVLYSEAARPTRCRIILMLSVKFSVGGQTFVSHI